MPIANIGNVAILMATYQGERYILEQLISLQYQEYTNWTLIISDDGSTDSTLHKIYDFFIKNIKKTVVISGPRKGFVNNFLSLLFRKDVHASYYSFSDQDDIWYKTKISRAVKWLNGISVDKPALYCSRTHLISETGESLGLSPLFTRLPSFCNALVQNIAGGNTMVINEAARKIIRQAGIVNVVSHDWWIYILISGVGGEIYYDPEPTLGYRQHNKNLIGMNIGLKARLVRLKKIIQGQYRSWNADHIREIEKIQSMLTIENQKTFLFFKKIHKDSVALRVYSFLKSGIYRQTLIDTFAIFFAALIKKL